jgi:hypothetical protein
MKNPLDLKQYTGDYINKTIFQLAFFCIILLTLYTMNADGWNFKPQKTYSCPYNEYNHSCEIKEGCEGEQVYPECIPTKTILLAPGEKESTGRIKTEADKNYGGSVAVILLAGFVANHVLWLYRRKKL